MATDRQVSEVGDTCRAAAGPGQGRSVQIEWLSAGTAHLGFPALLSVPRLLSREIKMNRRHCTRCLFSLKEKFFYGNVQINKLFALRNNQFIFVFCLYLPRILLNQVFTSNQFMHKLLLFLIFFRCLNIVDKQKNFYIGGGGVWTWFVVGLRENKARPSGSTGPAAVLAYLSFIESRCPISKTLPSCTHQPQSIALLKAVQVEDRHSLQFDTEQINTSVYQIPSSRLRALLVFLPLSKTISFEEEGRVEGHNESSFFCPHFANISDDPLPWSPKLVLCAYGQDSFVTNRKCHFFFFVKTYLLKLGH